METTLFSLTIFIECLPTPLKMNGMLILSGQQVWPTYFPQYLPFQLCLLPEADDSKNQILYFGNVSLSNFYFLSETHCTLLLIILFVSMWHTCWLYPTVIIRNHSYTLLTNCTCLQLLILVPVNSLLYREWTDESAMGHHGPHLGDVIRQPILLETVTESSLSLVSIGPFIYEL